MTGVETIAAFKVASAGAAALSKLAAARSATQTLQRAQRLASSFGLKPDATGEYAPVVRTERVLGPWLGERDLGSWTSPRETALRDTNSAIGEVESGRDGEVPLRDSTGEIATWVSPEEKAIYEEAGLEPQRVNDREALVRDDIDWDRKDNYGMSNLERAENGLAPLDAKGRPYELHHVQQKNDGQLAELARSEHGARGNYGVLHDDKGPSEIDRVGFDREVRPGHWKARAAEVRYSRGDT